MLLDGPPQTIENLLIRLPLPAGWRVDSVESPSATVRRAAGGDWQIAPTAGHHEIRFHVAAEPR